MDIDRHIDRDDDRDIDRPGWRTPPFDLRGLGLIVVAYVVLTGTLTLVGLAIVEWWEPSSAGRSDGDVNRWFERRRTDDWTHLAEIGSAFSDTITMVILAVVTMPVMLALYRRWHDWTVIAFGLILEVSTFATTSLLVGRDRPPVEQLDGAPTASFPSGHIAAAVVFYGGLAMIFWWNSRSPLTRTVGVVVAVVAPTAVVLSRLYLGMHYPTDALGGVALGLACLTVMRYVVQRGAVRLDVTTGASEPTRDERVVVEAATA
jgi:membrane-associated phospholipid phosphatase